MQVAILAGGLGTRLGSLTIDRPKSMVKVLGKPFLEYQLEFLHRGGIDDIVLCIGHLGDQIEEYFGTGKRFGVKIRYSREDRRLGTAGALKNAESLLREVFFTLYGDSYVFVDYNRVMSYFTSQNKLALMCVYKNCDEYERSNTIVEGGLVKRYSKKEKLDDMIYLDYGVSIFRKKVLDMIPTVGFRPLEDLFFDLIELRELLAFEVKKRFYEIGSAQGLEEFEAYLKGSK